MKTLKQFLSPKHTYPRNLWVKFPGFRDLYVRKGPYCIDGEFKESIQLANFAVRKDGQGSFRKLINFLEENYPHFTIVVENALTERLDNICRHMGFVQINAEFYRAEGDLRMGLCFAKGLGCHERQESEKTEASETEN